MKDPGQGRLRQAEQGEQGSGQKYRKTAAFMLASFPHFIQFHWSQTIFAACVYEGGELGVWGSPSTVVYTVNPSTGAGAGRGGRGRQMSMNLRLT